MSYTPADPGPGLSLGLVLGLGLPFALAGLLALNLRVNFLFGGGGAIEAPTPPFKGLGAGGLALKLMILFGAAAVKLVNELEGLPTKPAGVLGDPAPKPNGEEAEASPPKLLKPPRFICGR